MMLLLKRTILICIGLLAAVSTQAELGARNLQFVNFNAKDGLSAEFVQDIVQDGSGYIWIATQSGLNRFDGHEFKIYEPDAQNENSLSNNFIWSLFVDKAGELWIGTNNGVNKYNYATDNFTRNPLSLDGKLQGQRVRTLIQDRQGTFWIGTVDNGLIEVKPNGQVVHHQSAQKERGLPHNHIIALLEDSKGRLWVGTASGGLARMDNSTGDFIVYQHDPADPLSLTDNHVRSVYEDQTGQIWIGTSSGGLNAYSDGAGTFNHYQHDPEAPYSLSGGQILSIFEDAQGTLWIGTEQGLSEWRSSAESFFTYKNNAADPRSLANDQVSAIFQDASGVLWLATYGGISSWNYLSDFFAEYRASSGLFGSDVVTAIAESSENTLWVGTYGGGLTRLNPATNTARQYRHDPADPNSLADDRIMSLHVDQSGQVWVGTRSGGLNRLMANDQFERFEHDPNDPTSLSGNGVTAITSDPDGTLWVGVFGGGVNKAKIQENMGFTQLRHNPEQPNSLSSDRVLAIHRSRDGTLWVGTEKAGLNRLEESGQFTRISINEDQEDAVTVWGITEDRTGDLWFSTMNSGLIRWGTQARRAGSLIFEKYAKREGVAATVYAAETGAAGELWLSSNRGLLRLDPTAKTVTRYDHRNGLRGSEFLQSSSLHSSNGRLWFGSNQGLVGFFPGNLSRNERPPQVQVEVFSRDKSLLRVSSDDNPGSAQLGYSDPFIRFDFVALDFLSPDKNRYRYRLNGFDKGWINAGNFRRALYTNLPPGEYLFEVQGSNNDGIWNKQTAAVRVEVTPPFWQQTWAYAVYFLIACLSIGFYLRSQFLKRRKEIEAREHLEQQVAERTAELAKQYTELQNLNEKLAEASITDSLTGLRNRRYVDQFIEAEVAMVERRLVEGRTIDNSNGQRDSSKLMFFMMIDLDGFKAVNDQYGHQAGDEALLQVKALLSSCVRNSDVIIRWGGDEFMIIGHASTFEGVKVLAERIRTAVAQHEYLLSQGNTATLSASIGITPYPFTSKPRDKFNWEQVSNIADRAAYVSKENGRNAWVSIQGTDKISVKDFPHFGFGLQKLLNDGKVVIDSSLTKPLALDDEALKKAAG